MSLAAGRAAAELAAGTLAQARPGGRHRLGSRAYFVELLLSVSGSVHTSHLRLRIHWAECLVCAGRGSGSLEPRGRLEIRFVGCSKAGWCRLLNSRCAFSFCEGEEGLRRGWEVVRSPDLEALFTCYASGQDFAEQSSPPKKGRRRFEKYYASAPGSEELRILAGAC